MTPEEWVPEPGPQGGIVTDRPPRFLWEIGHGSAPSPAALAPAMAEGDLCDLLEQAWSSRSIETRESGDRVADWIINLPGGSESLKRRLESGQCPLLSHPDPEVQDRARRAYMEAIMKNLEELDRTLRAQVKIAEELLKLPRAMVAPFFMRLGRMLEIEAERLGRARFEGAAKDVAQAGAVVRGVPGTRLPPGVRGSPAKDAFEAARGLLRMVLNRLLGKGPVTEYPKLPFTPVPW